MILGYSELMRLLIYSGFNPRQKDNYWQTPLHLACINGNITAVKELCEQVSTYIICSTAVPVCMSAYVCKCVPLLVYV